MQERIAFSFVLLLYLFQFSRYVKDKWKFVPVQAIKTYEAGEGEDV
jgi:hypothetical protein